MSTRESDFDRLWGGGSTFDDLWGDDPPERKVGALGTAADVGEQVVAQTADFSLRNLRGVANLIGGVARSAQKINPALRTAGAGAIAEGATRASDALQRQREEVARYAPADTGAGVVAGVLTNIGEEGLSYIAGGGAIRKGLGLAVPKALPKTARLAPRLARGASEAAKDALAVTPLDVAATSVGPENSVAGAMADLTGSETARRIAANPLTRAGAEIATGLGADVALRGIAAGARAAGRSARRLTDLTPEMAGGLSEGVELGARELEGSATIPRPPYSSPEPMSARAVALRRAARGEIEAREAARRHALALVGAPAPEIVPILRGRTTPEPGILLPEPSALPEPRISIPPVTGGRGQSKARATVIPAPVATALPEPSGLLRSRRPGSASGPLTSAVARTGIGAAAGAALDDENPVRGAVLGAAALNAPAAVQAVRRAGRAAPVEFSEAVERVLGSESKPAAVAKLTRAREGIGLGARRLYARLVDETQPIRDFGKTMGAGEKLSNLVSQAKGWRGGAQRQLDTDFAEVVSVAKGYERPATRLAQAERRLELIRSGKKEASPDLIAREQEAVEVLSRIPEVRRAVDRLRSYYRSLLTYKLQNGVLSQESYAAIVESGDHYAPLVSSATAERKVPSAGGGRLFNRGSGVRKMGEGGFAEDAVDPFEQAILDTFETHRTVARQRVTNAVASLVEQDPESASGIIRRLKGDMRASKGREVVANIGGKEQRFEVLDEDLYDAWAAFDPRTSSIFVRVLSPFKRALQATVTIMPDFAIRNAIRDNTQSAIQYPFPVPSAAAGTALGASAGAVADEENRMRGALVGAGLGIGGGALAPQFVRMSRALGDIVGKAAIYDEWVREGGSGFSEFYARPSDARKLLREMRSDRSLWDTILLPVSGLQSLGRMVEEAPRLARYKQLRAAGKDVPEAIAKSRDISLDFANVGSDTKSYAQVTAFFNAKVQGFDKLARMLKEPKTWAAGAATLTAPSIALWHVNKDDPEYWERPQWERNLFWLVPRPEGGFYRIPKPFEVGMIFASLPERVLDYVHTSDPETLQHALGELLKTSTEGALPLPTGLEPILENAVNYDFFTNRPVVTPGLERLPDELQYSERTSALSRLAAKVPLFPDSPQKTENILRGWTGNVGNEVLAQADRALRTTGVDERPQQPEGRTPILGGFVTREDQASDPEIAVRRRFDEAEAAYLGVRRLMDRGEEDAASRFIDDHLDQLAEYEGLKALKSILDDASEARREVQLSSASPKEKRALLAEINRAVTGALGAGREQRDAR